MVFDEMKYILSYSSADTAIIMFTTVAQNVRLLPAHTLVDVYATRQLHDQ